MPPTPGLSFANETIILTDLYSKRDEIEHAHYERARTQT